MSLEAAVAENTAALNRVAALLEQSNAGRDAAIAKLTETAGADATKPARAPRAGRTPGPAAADTKPKEPEAQKNPAVPALPSVDDVRAAASKFVTVEDESEKARRKEFLRAVVEHLGCKVVECAEEDRAKVIAWFEAKARGEAVSFSDSEDDTSADDEDDIG